MRVKASYRKEERDSSLFEGTVDVFPPCARLTDKVRVGLCSGLVISDRKCNDANHLCQESCPFVPCRYICYLQDAR